MDLILYQLLKEKIAKMELEIEEQKSLIEFLQRTLLDHVNSWHSSCDTNYGA
jgi:hypothetical protein